MKETVIAVRPRTIRGKKNRALRRSGWIPAVIYGKGRPGLSFALDIRDAEKFSKREYENKIFTFQSEDSALNGLKAIKKETARHIVKRRPLHMDFLSLDMKTPIRVPVEMRYTGKPKGLQEGGVLHISLRNVEIECLPADIPPFIEADVSHLNINGNLHVSDLKVPSNIKLTTPASRTLCAVTEAEAEGSDTPAGAEGAAAAGAGAAAQEAGASNNKSAGTGKGGGDSETAEARSAKSSGGGKKDSKK